MLHLKLLGVPVWALLLIGAGFVLLPLLSLVLRRVRRPKTVVAVGFICMGCIGGALLFPTLLHSGMRLSVHGAHAFWEVTSMLFLVCAVLVGIAAVWTFLFGWVKVPVGHRSVVLFFGKPTTFVINDGWHPLFLKGFFTISKETMYDIRPQLLAIKPKNLWTAPKGDLVRTHVDEWGNETEDQFDNQEAEVRIVMDVVLQLTVRDPVRVLRSGGIGRVYALLETLVQEFLREEFRQHTEKEALDIGVQNSLKDDLKDYVDEQVQIWGVDIEAIRFADVDVDEQVKESKLKAYEEERQQEGEIIEVQTVARQAKAWVLETLNLKPGDAGYEQALADASDRIMNWRIGETASKSGTAVIMGGAPFGGGVTFMRTRDREKTSPDTPKKTGGA
jgi:regulator of protease activity HflC (stomatin/prohibitin superfamily)